MNRHLLTLRAGLGSMNTKVIRMAALLVAAGGVLGGLVFWYYYADGFAWRRLSNYHFVRTFAPYYIAAIAALLSRTRKLAVISFSAALVIAWLGIRMWLSYASTGPAAINDTFIVTILLQKGLSYLALAAAIVGWIYHLIRRIILRPYEKARKDSPDSLHARKDATPPE
jgi:hypothetical protein